MESCEAVDAWMPLFVSGRLEGAARQRLAAHLATCEPCREELGRLFRLRSQIEAMAERHAPSPAQLDRVFASLKGDPAFAAAPANRFDLRDRVPLAEHVQPLMWAQRIMDVADQLHKREWAIAVGSIVVAPAKGS